MKHLADCVCTYEPVTVQKKKVSLINMLGILEALERIEKKVSQTPNYRSSERAAVSDTTTDEASEREDNLRRQIIHTDEQISTEEANNALLLSKVHEEVKMVLHFVIHYYRHNMWTV